MSYSAKEIKKGIKLHCIETKKFKTNLIAVFITIPLSKDKVTKNAMIPAILRQGSKNFNTQEEINIKLEEMYGATFDCGIDKIGDNQIIKFYIETLNDEFIPSKEKLTDKAIELLFDIVFNPLIENDGFKKEYIDTEKENMKILINSKIDNKDGYSFNKCIEEMYKDNPYGLYKYGYVEDLEAIDERNLYGVYKEIITQNKIDIFISGDIEKEKIENDILNFEIINNLPEREGKYILNNAETEEKQEKEISTIEENMDVTQGKLVIGLDIFDKNVEARYIKKIYSVILGEGASSKMFQNVREKESLAYSARSMYISQKNNIFIRCGIEIPNFEKALKVIKEQIEDMKNGKFTDEDLENAKKYMTSGLDTVEEEQDSELTYYFGQEIAKTEVSIDEYKEKINEIKKEQVKNMAEKMKINTIYFLRN